jgi:hypothetical protein
LFDNKGVLLYPEVMSELDAIKMVRIAGLMLRRHWGKHDPWPTCPKEDEIDLTHITPKGQEGDPGGRDADQLTFTFAWLEPSPISRPYDE